MTAEQFKAVYKRPMEQVASAIESLDKVAAGRHCTTTETIGGVTVALHSLTHHANENVDQTIVSLAIIAAEAIRGLRACFGMESAAQQDHHQQKPESN